MLISAPLSLALLDSLKDRFEPKNRLIKGQPWSLRPAALVISVAMMYVYITSFWCTLPFLQKYELTFIRGQFLSFFWYCFVLLSAFAVVHYIYRLSFIQVFGLTISQIPFIIKLCIGLGIVNTLSVYLLQLNLILSPDRNEIEIIRKLDIKEFVFYCVTLLILTPIAAHSSEVGHAVQAIPATQSRASRPPVPGDAGHVIGA